MKPPIDKIIEEFEEEFKVIKEEAPLQFKVDKNGANYCFSEKTKKDLKSFISQKFPEYAREIIEKKYEEWWPTYTMHIDAADDFKNYLIKELK